MKAFIICHYTDKERERKREREKEVRKGKLDHVKSLAWTRHGDIFTHSNTFRHKNKNILKTKLIYFRYVHKLRLFR